MVVTYDSLWGRRESLNGRDDLTELDVDEKTILK